MAEVSLALEEPYNSTDPYVVFDPEVEKPIAVKDWVSEENQENAPAESTKIDGILEPIVAINTTMIEARYIRSFSLSSKGFTPKLELEIEDPNRDKQFIGSPGLANSAIVILTPRHDGLYRKISLPFYIVDRVNIDDNVIKYSCEFKNIMLTCPLCEDVDSNPISTYDMCSKIAKKLGLGFAATENCEGISDERYRQIYSQKLQDFIQDQIKIGGLDENSIFDAWIDLHGYLVMVNLPYIFNSEIKMTNLMTLVQNSLDLTQDSNQQDSKPYEFNRMLSNLKEINIPSLYIEDFYDYVDNSNAQDNGTIVSYWYLTDVGTDNTIVQEDVQMIEDSVEGVKRQDLYAYPKVEFAGAEMSEDTPYLMQEKIVKSYKIKKFGRQLCVRLSEANYGIERGTLVNVVIYESDPNKVSFIKQNASNITNPIKTEEGSFEKSDDVENVDIADQFGSQQKIMNPAISGMYYVNGLEFVYDPDNRKMIEYLYLIKKGVNNPLVGIQASAKISTQDTNVLGSVNNAEKS